MATHADSIEGRDLESGAPGWIPRYIETSDGRAEPQRAGGFESLRPRTPYQRDRRYFEYLDSFGLYLQGAFGSEAGHKKSSRFLSRRRPVCDAPRRSALNALAYSLRHREVTGIEMIVSEFIWVNLLV